MTTPVLAPLAGTVTAMTQVPDPVFAQQLVGPGLAIDPVRGSGTLTAKAPIAGKIAKVHPHAFVIVGDDAHAVLVHLGLDTVKLNGAGFSVHVSEGETVAAGADIVTWNPDAIAAGGLNPIVPVIALDADASALTLTTAAEVQTGQTLFAWS